MQGHPMIKIIQMEESDTDNVTKYILEDSIFGKNEVSVIRKDTKNIIVLPTQTNCNMGCKFCHLTGTTRSVKNLDVNWFSTVINLMIEDAGITDKPLLISFMGAGEPLNNINSVMNTIDLHSGLPNIRFALATMVPNISFLSFITSKMEERPHTSLKIHLSVHGTFNRHKLINSPTDIHASISTLREYNELTNNHIEYHYTLVDGVNDSIEELTDFRHAIQCSNAGYRLNEMTTVKFLSLSECGEYRKTKLTEEQIKEIFRGCVVEFYDPPGRDVGSSCGMFDRSLYI
jgi:adenine C2-methylase RlmN of 23S rRNA A2503 and tRNA A37